MCVWMCVCMYKYDYTTRVDMPTKSFNFGIRIQVL